MMRRLISVVVAILFLINSIFFAFASTSKIVDSKTKKKTTASISKNNNKLNPSVSSSKKTNSVPNKQTTTSSNKQTNPSPSKQINSSISKQSNISTNKQHNAVTNNKPVSSVPTIKQQTSKPSQIQSATKQEQYKRLEQLFVSFLTNASNILNETDVDKQMQMTKDTKLNETVEEFNKLFPEVQKDPLYKGKAEYCKREMQRMYNLVNQSIQDNLAKKKQTELQQQKQKQLQEQKENEVFMQLYNNCKNLIAEMNQILDKIEQEPDPQKRLDMIQKSKEGRQLTK